MRKDTSSDDWSWWMLWEDLLFLHWRARAAELEKLLPEEVEPETYGGSGWIGIVAFRMRIRPRAFPLLGPLGRFPECNVRTYVTHRGVPGVWFFSLDVPNPVAVAVARWRFRLPYRLARMRVRWEEGWIAYEVRRWRMGPGVPVLEARYRGGGAARLAEPGSLERFLTERDLLYSADGRGRLYAAPIAHPPWQLAAAEVRLARQTLLAPLGLAPEGPPLAHYAPSMEVRAWRLAPVDRGRSR